MSVKFLAKSSYLPRLRKLHLSSKLSELNSVQTNLSCIFKIHLIVTLRCNVGAATGLFHLIFCTVTTITTETQTHTDANE